MFGFRIFILLRMKYIIKKPGILLVCAFILFYIGIPGFAAEYLPSGFPPGLNWQQIESEHFIVVFDEHHQKLQLFLILCVFRK